MCSWSCFGLCFNDDDCMYVCPVCIVQCITSCACTSYVDARPDVFVVHRVDNDVFRFHVSIITSNVNVPCKLIPNEGSSSYLRNPKNFDFRLATNS